MPAHTAKRWYSFNACMVSDTARHPLLLFKFKTELFQLEAREPQFTPLFQLPPAMRRSHASIPDGKNFPVFILLIPDYSIMGFPSCTRIAGRSRHSHDRPAILAICLLAYTPFSTLPLSPIRPIPFAPNLRARTPHDTHYRCANPKRNYPNKKPANRNPRHYPNRPPRRGGKRYRTFAL